MAQIRLTTEGRAILCELTDEEQILLRSDSWRIYGGNTAGRLVMIGVGGVTFSSRLGKDGRMMIHGARDNLGITEELAVVVRDKGNRTVVLEIVGREQPTQEKAARLAATPERVRLPAVDPNALTLFEELTPQRRRKGGS